jgi:hypothetical protein
MGCRAVIPMAASKRAAEKVAERETQVSLGAFGVASWLIGCGLPLLGVLQLRGGRNVGDTGLIALGALMIFGVWSVGVGSTIGTLFALAGFMRGRGRRPTVVLVALMLNLLTLAFVLVLVAPRLQ